MFTKKFNSYAASILAATVLATGCVRVHNPDIGSVDSKPELRGMTTVETLEHSGAEITRMHVDGNALQQGKSYTFNGVSLIIHGDVPRDVSIIGNGGQLIVTGNVGANTEIKISVPEFTHTEKHICSRPEPVGLAIIRHDYICDSTVDDAPKPPYDKDPVIVIEGKARDEVKLLSNTGTFFVIKGHGPAV